MESNNLGYQHLIDQYKLPARPLTVSACLDTAVKGRGIRIQGNREILVFEPPYAPKNSMIGHIQFALRYEGMNIEVLALLFQQSGGEELQAWLVESPESKYARRAGFLYLKETHSSFEVERERPSTDRAQRFADLLRQADIRYPLTEQRLIELQHAVVDPRFHEPAWRTRQNWLGRDLGYRRHMDFVPPRPEDVPGLMAGLLTLVESSIRLNQESPDGEGMDPVLLRRAWCFPYRL